MLPAGIPGKGNGLMPKRHLEGKTKEERVNTRSKLGPLRTLTVQPATRARYDKALQQFFTFLTNQDIPLPKERYRMDAIASDYVEHLWSTGEGRALAADTIAALQDSQPQLRGHLQGTWRLLKTWNTSEIPNRAPPMPVEVLEAMIGHAIFHGRPLFALSLLLGFYGLLRTGEILGLTKQHLAVASRSTAVLVSLGLTKGGKRQGAAESVKVAVEDIIRRTQQWLSTPLAPLNLTDAPHIWRKLFSDTLDSLGFSHLQFRPYSLRRGGATFQFRQEGCFDRLMVHGRWHALKTTRLYINEGMSILAELAVPWSPFSRTLRTQYLSSLQKALPMLEPLPKGRSGGVGRQTKKAEKQPRKAEKQPKHTPKRREKIAKG